nr:paramyosin isoform X2 [Syngnathus scovelli]
MNWDRQVSSILSAADDSVANMRGRLSSLGNTSKREESFQFKEKFHDSDFDTLAVSAPSSSAQQVRPVNPGVQWADIASIQSQLQTQNQVIMESLTKKLRDIEQEKQSQQFHMQTLQAEVDRLRQDLRGRRREKDFGGQEQVMSDVGTSAFPKDSWSSKTCRAELEHLRKEVEQLKTRLRRQEEAMMLQEKEAREHRRQCQHSSEQMLQELTDRYKSHSTDLAKRSFEYVQKEVHHISNTVSELEGEVIRLRERQITLTANDSPRVKVEEAKQDSDSDDFSPTASLAEISSDLSLLDDLGESIITLALERQSIPSGVKNDFLDEEEYDDRDILDDDDDVNPEFGSDLSLTDF